RALEGELARSINSIASVETSRVDLAIPKPSVFVRGIQTPTASVILSLHPTRKLNQMQVNGILQLISNSVPELLAENVTIIDQNGNLLSKVDNQSAENMIDQTQLKYIDELQKGIVRRIESILIPVLGQENIRAEATVDVDFSHSEQAAEIYTPNNTPINVAKRSEHSKSSTNEANSKVGGVPGATSNQPSQLNQLPILNQATPTAINANPLNDEHETTTNYEVDKTVSFIKNPTGTINRLTVAVVVNNKTELDKHGNPVSIAINDDEILQLTNLVKQAMGYKVERGDALSVVNIAFKNTVSEHIAPPVYWHQFLTFENAKTALQYLLGLSIIAYLLSILKPLVKQVLSNKKATDLPIDLNQPEVNGQFTNIEATRKMAAENPQIAASVIKNWVNK
ncbi:MAG: flagellar basal-body MS-ring/collar protein FliF, partial [Methylococcaceae bacterium]